MLRIYVVLLILAGLLLAGCSASSSLPQSSLTLRNATTNALISTSKTTGGITLNIGDPLPLLVIRTFTNEDGNTESSDVTQFANFKWANGTGIASVDAFGNITALQAGQAQLEVKFRASTFDPWDIVRLDVSVI